MAIASSGVNCACATLLSPGLVPLLSDLELCYTRFFVRWLRASSIANNRLRCEARADGGAEMSIRFAIIYVSVAVVFCAIVAFLSGPLWGLRLDYEKGQQIQLLQILLPTFLSYLGAAVTYATVGSEFSEPIGERGRILRIITLAGVSFFLIGTILSTSVYYLSANGTLTYGRLEFNQYAAILTMLIGILSVTTSIISTYIFAARKSGTKHSA